MPFIPLCILFFLRCSWSVATLNFEWEILEQIRDKSVHVRPSRSRLITTKSKNSSRYAVPFQDLCCRQQWNTKYLAIGSYSNGRVQEVTKRCRISWLTNSALVYEPKCVGRGSCGGVSQWVQLYTGAQINFGDLTSPKGESFHAAI